MKKYLLVLVAILGLFIVGCSGIQTATVTKSNVVKSSSLADVKVDKVIYNEFFITLENKSNDLLEVLLSESTINNNSIYDGEELDKVAQHNALAALGGMANSFNSLGAQPYIKEDDSKIELSKKSSNIVLNVGEKIAKRVGYSMKPTEFPAKVVVKLKQNDKTEYVYLNVEDTKETVKVDSKNGYKKVE